MSTLEVYPSGYDTERSSWLNVYDLQNCYTSTDSNTSARFYIKKGSSKTYVYLTFDLSSIPMDATINSVTCKAKSSISTDVAARIETREVQMFSGDTPKGSATVISTQILTETLNVGEWTREELDALSLRFYAARGYSGTNNSQFIDIFGATLTIDYESGGVTQTLKIKNNGSWQDVNKVYKKENGSWVEQTDLSQVFDTNTNYVKEN